MRFMPAPKILLFLGFLSVMGPALSAPFDPGVAYRFGDWTLARAKGAPQPTAQSPLLYRVAPASGQFEEIYLYHGDGDQRGLVAEPKSLTRRSQTRAVQAAASEKTKAESSANVCMGGA